jgi:DNA-binding SARP family transcriptional activator
MTPEGIPVVDLETAPLPLPEGARAWSGLPVGYNVEQGQLWCRWAGAEQAMLVLGPPRSGKTSSIVIPSIWDAPGAVVSTSTKPDVLLGTYKYRWGRGTCYVFDPTLSAALPEGVKELRWSPLGGCQSFDASVSMAHALAGAGRPGAGHTEAAHWVERAEALLAPLLHAAASAGKTIGDVCAWVLGHDVAEAEAILSATGAQMARVTLSSVWRTEERERSGIFSTAASILSVYRSESALASASRPNFDPERFAASNDTVYVCAPAYAQDQLAPLVVALLEQIRAACYARRRRFPDAVPTLFILDEVANIAPLPTLPQLASEGVSQGVVTLACLQDLSQARQRWGPAADGFFSLFGTKLIFPGIADHGTLELVSALLGDVQVPMQSVSAPQPRGWGDIAMRVLSGGYRSPDPRPVVTNSTTFRRRLPVDEIYRGSPGSVLVLGPGVSAYAPAAPWWELVGSAAKRPTPTLAPSSAPRVPASPWRTPGTRVLARSSARWSRSWIVVVPGDPLPMSELLTVPVDVTGDDYDNHSDALDVVEDSVAQTRPSRQVVTAADGVALRHGAVVRVLGPVEVEGWSEVPSRKVVSELACYLVLHGDRNVTGEELRAAIWPGDLRASAKSLRNVVSLLRKALGPDLVPEAQKGSGYHLAPGVSCDWTIFSGLVATATGPDEMDRLREALALVRGAPFDAVASGSFTWAWTELFVSGMEVAVATAARRLGALAIAQDDIELSVWALLQGLSASPYDRELWSAYLGASARSGRDVLETSWKNAKAVLGDDCRDLADVIEHLRSQTVTKFAAPGKSGA